MLYAVKFELLMLNVLYGVKIELLMLNVMKIELLMLNVLYVVKIELLMLNVLYGVKMSFFKDQCAFLEFISHFCPNKDFHFFHIISRAPI